MNGVPPQFRASAMCGFSLGGQAQPKITLMGSDHLAASRFTDQRKVRIHVQICKSSRPGLVAFLINKPDENNLGFCGALPALGQALKRMEHNCNTSFRVAGASPVYFVSSFSRGENFRKIASDCVHLRC